MTRLEKIHHDLIAGHYAANGAEDDIRFLLQLIIKL